MTQDQAGELLRTLLTDPERPYRRQWELRGAAQRGSEFNTMSIGRVLAQYLLAAQRIDEQDEQDWPRKRRQRLKDQLTGARLSLADLDDYGVAFEMAARDRVMLRSIHLSSGAAAPLDVAHAPPAEPEPLRHELVRVHEEHYLGPGRLPVRHLSRHTLRATDDGVAVYPYRFDTFLVSVDVRRGGVPGQIREVRPGIWELPVHLDRTLAIGETIDLEYATEFYYREPPEPLFRRGVGVAGQTEIDIEVHFDPTDLPSFVRQSHWPALDAEPDLEAEVELGAAIARAAYLNVESGYIGLRWGW